MRGKLHRKGGFSLPGSIHHGWILPIQLSGFPVRASWCRLRLDRTRLELQIPTPHCLDDDA